MLTVIRKFVMTELFDISWKEAKLKDDDLRQLQAELLRNPKSGDAMQGTGGFRKVRYAPEYRGKSGGLRVVYLDIPEFEVLYLMLAFPKNKKATLSKAECNELKKISSNIKRSLYENKGRGNVKWRI